MNEKQKHGNIKDIQRKFLIAADMQIQRDSVKLITNIPSNAIEYQKIKYTCIF